MSPISNREAPPGRTPKSPAVFFGQQADAGIGYIQTSSDWEDPMSSPRITIGIVLVIAGIITGFLSSTWIISTNIATLWMLSLGGCGLLAIGGAFLMPPRNEQDAPARYVPPRFAGATELHLEELPEPTAGRRLLEFAAATIINAAFLGTLAL